MVTPRMRMGFNIGTQEVLQHANSNLTLTIRLRMECSAESQIRSEDLEKLLLETAGEPWIAI